MEVLANNQKSIGVSLKAGFEKSSGLIVKDWNRKFEMRHKDTAKYRPPQALAIIPKVPQPQ